MKKKTLTEGPLGFPMPDALAKALEALLKTLPKDKAYSYRKAQAVPSLLELLEGERADVSTISTDSLDRDNEVVLPKGVGLTYFQKNPIVTFAHKYDELPIGKAQWVKMVNGQLKAKTKYADKPDGWEGPWLPDAVWAMTQQGILKGKSIGFIPTKIRSPTRDEIGERPEWKNASCVIESSVLLEYAIAPIPMNQDALVEAVSKGIADAATLRRLGINPPARPRRKAGSSLEDFLKALEGITLDPAKIAEQVYQNIKQRGKV